MPSLWKVALIAACLGLAALVGVITPIALYGPFALATASAQTVSSQPSTGSNRAALSTAPSPSQTPLCHNDYYPVVPGARWDYAIRLPNGAQDTYAYKLDSVMDNGFIAHRSQKTWQADLVWLCKPQGLVQDRIDNVNGDVHIFSPDAVPALSDWETHRNTIGQLSTVIQGVTLPRSEDWAADYAWTLTYWNYSFADVDVRKYAVVYESHLAALETVTVPAGVFQAWRIDSVAGPLQSTTWYARGVGLVKMVQSYPAWPVTTHELLSYSIPGGNE